MLPAGSETASEKHPVVAAARLNGGRKYVPTYTVSVFGFGVGVDTGGGVGNGVGGGGAVPVTSTPGFAVGTELPIGVGGGGVGGSAPYQLTVNELDADGFSVYVLPTTFPLVAIDA